MRFKKLLVLSAIVVSVGGFAVADSHDNSKELMAATKARQAQMQLYTFNLATLGAIAKGEVEYSAEAASAAANNLAALAGLDQSNYWLPGSDNVSIEGTRALPAIWEAGSDIGDKGAAFGAAATAMQVAAGTGLEGLQGAMGPLGASCGGCHKAYRGPAN